jgi:predicted glycoside hydrolase/deacetylase ChbG (UPF0249 family)
VNGQRNLIVTADDYGIGPATSQGILDLAVQGRLTATVLLVNSPHADAAVQAWRRVGRPLVLGWHPCLTLDAPVLPASSVPSLVRPDGRFWPLGAFVRRLYLAKIQAAEIEAELRAQFYRFRELTGFFPTVVNSHHHTQVFSPVGAILCRLLDRRLPIPYVRRVQEPWSMLLRVPGARVKRLFLSIRGRRDARRQQRAGFPGNTWLAGITDPPCVADPAFLTRWLSRIPGLIVELTCHPGYLDTTLIGRDCTPDDGQLRRRVHEFQLLQHSSFLEACRQAQFRLVSPCEFMQRGGLPHAA